METFHKNKISIWVNWHKMILTTQFSHYNVRKIRPWKIFKNGKRRASWGEVY